MGIAKRIFSDLLTKHRYNDEGSSTYSADSESEDLERDEVKSCQSGDDVLVGQTDIRSYLLAPWRWKPTESFAEDEEAARAMQLPFHMQDDDVTDLQAHANADADALEADEDAAQSMGMPFHMEDDDYVYTSEDPLIGLGPDLAADGDNESFEADEDAARSMGLPLHVTHMTHMTHEDEDVQNDDHEVDADQNFVTPIRRKRQCQLAETPEKKPRLAFRAQVVQPSQKKAPIDQSEKLGMATNMGELLPSVMC
ncbi:unnamed protein product [Symbiodinium pilosum]|uniref:Uncharacterized protein n=1 Tax=Symbiodinium pilosum TaxID=2952 RepID=A0A812WTA8_SYMPI|nr:unnamed protein product [Symbiodinium pilosum]